MLKSGLGRLNQKAISRTKNINRFIEKLEAKKVFNWFNINVFSNLFLWHNFYPLTCEWVRQVVGKTHDNLLASGGRAGKALVEEGTGDVEVFVDESVGGIGGLCIGVIGRQSTFPCDMV